MTLSQPVPFFGNRRDDVRAAVVGVVDTGESAADRARSPGAVVGVQVRAGVELWAGIVVVRERHPSGASGVRLVPLRREFLPARFPGPGHGDDVDVGALEEFVEDRAVPVEDDGLLVLGLTARTAGLDLGLRRGRR